jgi:hypothetical protein
MSCAKSIARSSTSHFRWPSIRFEGNFQMTTLRQQNSAIMLTATAKAAGQNAGVTLTNLQTQLDEHLAEVAVLLRQILAFHPSTGGDAANYSALQSILSAITT